MRIEHDLYGADAATILRRLGAVDPSVASAMVVGHNPGLQQLAIELSGDGDGSADASALQQLHTKFPTAALATITFDAEWARLKAGRGHLASLVLPRQLPQ